MDDLGNDIAKAGWRPVLSPAMPRDNVPQAGRTLLAVKRGLNARPFAHLASHTSQCYGASDGGKKERGHGPVDFHDFSAMSIRASWQQIVVAHIHLGHGIG
eukprot:189458-Pyramimonas_sp.AAC.1